MRQYCRYCVHLTTGNGIWCEERHKSMTEAACKTTNNCKKFEFCEIDAFDENQKPYKPREELQAVDEITENQMKMF